MTDCRRFGELLEMVKRRLASANSFTSLTALCDGAFPATVAEALRQLSPKIPSAYERLAEAEQSYHLRPFSDRRLPLPHPLDFEWRFSNASIDLLLRKLNSIAGARGKLLFVCAPAVALRAFDAKNPRRLIYASRMDDPVTASLMEVCGDRMEFVEVRDDLSRVDAAAALVDPPWYDDIALPLVTQALRGLEEGGGLLIGVPDRFSGCSSARMLSSMAADARPFGLEGAYLLAGKLRYETPYFELNTLRSLGLHSVHPQWRTGQLVFGRRTRNPVPTHSFPRDNNWGEVRAGGWRARLRRRSGYHSLGCHPILLNIRHSVSRFGTHSGSEECWTVGNRVAYAPFASGPAAYAIHEIAQLELGEIQVLVADREEAKNAMENRQIMLPAKGHAIYSAGARN
jgi:hypothetical protein